MNPDILNAQKLLMLTEQQDANLGGEAEEEVEEAGIIPPVGLAHPKFIEAFQENIGDEDALRRDIKDLEDYHKENFSQTAEREVKSYGLRALEGLGGSIFSLLNGLSGDAYFDESGEFQPNAKMLPNSRELRELTKEKTGKKFEPKTELSKNTHEIATDLGALAAVPGGWVSKVLGTVAGQGAKALVKSQGGEEGSGDLAKMAVMMLTTIGNIGNAPQMARQAYSEAVNQIPQNATMSAQPITNALNRIKNSSWFRTGRTTAKGPAFDEIERIENAISSATMNVQDALQIRRDINEARKKLGAFNYEPGIDKASARRFLGEVEDALVGGIENYGRATNPTWLENYNLANQAYAVTQRSRQLQDVIASSPIAKKLQSQTAKTLFNVAGAHAALQAPGTLLAAVGPVAAVAKSAQIMNRMIRSPLLRRYYAEVLASASAQNSPALARSLQKFDETAKKIEKHQSSQSERANSKEKK